MWLYVAGVGECQSWLCGLRKLVLFDGWLISLSPFRTHNTHTHTHTHIHPRSLLLPLLDHCQFTIYRRMKYWKNLMSEWNGERERVTLSLLTSLYPLIGQIVIILPLHTHTHIDLRLAWIRIHGHRFTGKHTRAFLTLWCVTCRSWSYLSYDLLPLFLMYAHIERTLTGCLAMPCYTTPLISLHHFK